ncbi:unnamed protein product [Kuraishia capsulata CBS 1993]|uniref:Mannosyltransferase n=1 Tax=Kuraishia capsulata CBS 1993 TaxID=1382522 RepID=W6MI62_9ASCO|nr:uncharacterized protein KUCA_T00001786001 [Kuraishia capsulata CBS 1993]CDK25816.1 unnamed protein product [Kuraishia capsulata CBS 1993]
MQYWGWLDSAFIVLISTYLVLAPYSKVEESFSLQAVYDMLNHGYADLELYDHKTFEGAVPRSFFGPLLISVIVKPIKPLLDKYYPDPTELNLQLLVRGVIGLTNGLSLIRLRRSLAASCALNSKYISVWFAVLQYSQFHIVYYASRSLPNFLALPFVNHALAYIVKGEFVPGVTWMCFTGVVMRLEVGLYGCCFALMSVLLGQSSLITTLGGMVAGSLVGLGTTLFVDSYFWGHLEFPELTAFIYNVVEGNSQNWGVEPFSAYFFKYSRALFFPPIVPIMLVKGLTKDPSQNGKGNTIRTICISSLLFVFVMSFQAHKEWRFIIYAVPALTVVGANGADLVVSQFGSSIPNRLLSLLAFVLPVVSLGTSLFMGYVSSFNYPGGVALANLNERLLKLDQTAGLIQQEITVHMDIPACMTGITLFGQLKPESLTNFKVNYDKNENRTQLLETATWEDYNYVITDLDSEADNQYLPKALVDTKLKDVPGCNWYKVDVVQMFAGVQVAPFVEYAKEIANDGFQLCEDIISLDTTNIKKVLDDSIILKDALYVYEKVCNDVI